MFSPRLTRETKLIFADFKYKSLPRFSLVSFRSKAVFSRKRKINLLLKKHFREVIEHIAKYDEQSNHINVE